ncbi:MAG: 3-isopropylmalate dehydratase small subunit [Candidatus Omnitrophica bacterium]|nr:3-isopropylmalate dehydratase small subunit [Candidatus Omnitrophota bacterium]MCM8788621.1 3-isopropylmalate dehydratase small subunit [Candidatus Omnitrophota bacterium]
MRIRGKVWRFGDHINTDDIIAARYLNTTDINELASHCMETIFPDFSKKIVRGDIIVAGENFGCGSSREHAPIAIKGCGISLVMAKSFARIFFRNAINIGLPIIETNFVDRISQGDVVDVDFDTGIILDITNNEKGDFFKYPEFLQQIIKSGGLMLWAKEKYIK